MSNLKRMKVLLIEPDLDFRIILRDMLQAMNIINVEETGSAEVGMGMVDEFRPDLIIIAKETEPMDGPAFTKALRSGRAGDDCVRIPIVLTARITERKEVIEARDSGISEFLTKPFSANQLKARVESALYRAKKFITSDGYVGPDRRRTEAVYIGRERRTGEDE